MAARPENLYSLQQVAQRLGLHVRTIRSYVRTGRLQAVRIGKQYRVTREQLDALTGKHGVTSDQGSLERHTRAEASSVIQIDALSPELASRITALLLGAAGAPREENSSLRVDTLYDAARGNMKIIVIGNLSATESTFKMVAALLE
jgi:excisionase family DNA binding protein